MALPKVDITLTNGGLALAIPNADSVAGLIVQGPAPTGLALLTPTQIFTLQDATALGIDEAYDTANTVTAYKQIKEFYDEAGNGKELWIMVVSTAVTLTTMCDKTQANYAVKLLNAAGGKIRILGITRSPAGGYTPVTTSGIDADVTTALVNAQALAVEYQDTYKPFRIILPAMYFQGGTTTLPDLKALSAPNCQVMLGDTASGTNAAVGLLLGRYAAIPVQRNPGRVKNGALTALAAYFATTALEAASLGAPLAYHTKGYVTFRTFVGKAGYFFTDDPTAVADTNDYSSFARGRVIDKALTIAYTTFINEILDEVTVDADGKLPLSYTKYIEGLIENAININMTANAEISSFRAFVDANQNVISTGKICIEMRITPVGYSKEILVKLGFENPAIS